MNASSTKMKEPSILIAGANCQKLVRNLSYVLDAAAVQRLHDEVNRNVLALYALGEDHLGFAQTVPGRNWRQRVSRLYYGALNIKRAVTLHHSGDFSTDASDHKKIGNLPPDFPNENTYSTRLTNLRDDRNIADYSHLSTELDLVIPLVDAQTLVVDFREHARSYLQSRGLTL